MSLSLFLICLAAIAWGTTGTTATLLAQVVSISPWVVGFWRMALASPILLLLTSLEPQFWQWPSAQERWVYLSLGACMAVYQICYFAAVPLAGVAVTALVAICSSPLLIALLAAIFLSEKLTLKVYWALGLGITGTVLLITGPEAFALGNRHFLWGVLLALAAATAYSGYAVLAKATVKKMRPMALTAYGFTSAALLLTPTLWWQPTWQDWVTALPWLLYLGTVTTALAYSLYMIGLKHTPVTIAGIAVLLEPLTATLLGVFYFHETMGALGILGAGLLLGAITLLSLPPRTP